MADNYLEKRYDEVFGSGSGRETVAVHGNLLIRKRGGRIVSVKKLPQGGNGRESGKE